MKRLDNEEERSKSHSFSARNSDINEFDFNCKNFEIETMVITLKPRETLFSKGNLRSAEIKKFIYYVNKKVQEEYKKESKSGKSKK